MIDKTAFKTIQDIIKSMKSDRYIIMNGFIVGATVTKNKKQYDVIESISYVNVGITVDRMYSFSDKQFKDFQKTIADKYNMYDIIFGQIFDDPLIIGNFQLYNAFNSIYKSLYGRVPDFTIENIKENERMFNSYDRTVKYGLDMVPVNNRYIVPIFKSMAPSLKNETITLNIYEDITYVKYGYNSNNIAPSIVADYVVNKKKYQVHNLFRIIPSR